MASFSDHSSRGSSTGWITTIPLRIGVGATLFYLHGWGEAVAGWHYLVKQETWPLIGLLEKATMPYPIVLAYIAATLTTVTPACWIIGFLTRFFSIAILPVIIGALLLANRLGEHLEAEAALLYLLIALTLFITGPGWFSVDALFKERRRTTRR